MAVLEAVHGWDALKPAEEPLSESTSEVSQATETEIPITAAEKMFWTDDRISELKTTDPLSVLLEHERHIFGSGSDDIGSACECLRLVPSAGGLKKSCQYLGLISISRMRYCQLTSIFGIPSLGRFPLLVFCPPQVSAQWVRKFI
jgi:hypothetical protein